MIYAVGDLHIPHDVRSINARNFPEGKTLTKKDYLIVLGDFGLIWGRYPDSCERYYREWLEKKSWTTLVVPGNHENWDRIQALPVVEMLGGRFYQYSESIFIMIRGETYTVDGKTFWNFGGADSIDKARRREGISWWPQELANYSEFDHGLQKLEEAGSIDYIVTHTCPESVFKTMSGMVPYDPDPMRTYFEEVSKRIDFKHWYFGHFHENWEIPKYTCLYDRKVKI